MLRKEYKPGTPGYDAHVKGISAEVVRGLRRLDAEGKLAEAGERVAQAINDLREERILTPRELNRRAII
ncbi:MAG: hypothetical protein KJ600_02185 [Nanoarchaeota archaeon]|nr:hypothetical protein [Nanoarchaeota archaeon]MBU1103343.1 hypothetical protein [Nanoarchaeota archaeon]